MKRVMIVGASAWQVPMIQKAKELGYYVGVADYNPKAVGIQYADEYFNTSTIDPEGVCKATKAFHADGITTVATDMPMKSVAYTCEKLGLTGISQETAFKATDKARMMEAFEEEGVPHPWYFIALNGDFSSLESRLTFPCICKPTDNSASRGVVLINSKEELIKGVKYSSENGRSGDVIIEELMLGDEISVEAFAVKGVIHILQITDKLTTGSPHFVEMGHYEPSKHTGKVREKIIDVTIRAMKAIGIDNGPAHVEMMVTEQGPKLIELGARLGGDFITTDLVPLSTGIDMLGATIQLACGETVSLIPTKNSASAIRYMHSAHGRIKEIIGLEEANSTRNIVRVSMLKNIGDIAPEITNSIDRIGYAIAVSEHVSEAEKVCEEAIEKIKIEIS